VPPISRRRWACAEEVQHEGSVVDAFGEDLIRRHQGRSRAGEPLADIHGMMQREARERPNSGAQWQEQRTGERNEATAGSRRRGWACERVLGA
jgi:hypothetical protein